MDTFGDYIYIILLVIAGLSGLLQSQKKKKNAEQAQPSFPDLDDVLSDTDDFFDSYPSADTDYDIPRVQRDIQEVFAKVNQTKQAMSSVKSDNLSSSIAPAAHSSVHSSIEEDGDTDNSILSAINLEDVEEAQKAFIYSEIFNRKYN